jgi:undecaprenyl-diphosphatase
MRLPARLTLPQFRLAVAAAMLAAVWLAMLILGRGALDQSVYEALYAGSSPALVNIARFFTFLGEPTVLVGAGFLVAVWLWRRKHPHLALALLLIFLVGRGLTEVQKYWIARARPTLEPHLVIVQTSSFPSGHAASSMIFYLTLALALAPRTRWRRIAALLAVILSLSVGISRVMLGVHWPSDVIGGWSFGALWVLLTLRRAQRLFRVELNPDEGSDKWQDHSPGSRPQSSR